jgi:hypothetical protein
VSRICPGSDPFALRPGHSSRRRVGPCLSGLVPGTGRRNTVRTGVIRSTFVVDEKGKIAVAQYNVKATGHVAKLRRDLSV